MMVALAECSNMTLVLFGLQKREHLDQRDELLAKVLLYC